MKLDFDGYAIGGFGLGEKREDEFKIIKLHKKLIPENKSVYIADYGEASELPFSYRMALILALKEKDIRRNLSQTDYMAIETSIPYKSGTYEERYDFYILTPLQKPPFPAELIWLNIFASAWKAD